MTGGPMHDAMSLHQAGRLEEAAGLYRRILRANPAQFEALYSLGMVQFQAGQLEEAQDLLARAMQLNPRFAEGWCARGIVLLQLRRREEAIACFDRALALRPDFIDALSSRATALLELARLEEALAAFDRVVALKPDHAISWNNRGNAFVAMRRLEEAVASFDKALALQPDLATAERNRELALLELKRIRRIPGYAVRALFDDYARTFDAAMLGPLEKRDHLRLRELADRVLPHPPRPLAILDLGCGTGLSGHAFRDLAAGGRLDGIDLSPLMIEKARERGIYGDLAVGDFETILSAPGPHYDLAIAVDAFNYHGDLAQVLAGAAGRLAAGGFCLFTLEKTEEEGWEQTPANRFRHSETYVRRVAAESGFSVAEIAECTPRLESDVPVPGFAVALRKTRGFTPPV